MANIAEPGACLFEIGAGGGAVARELTRAGYNITATEPSETGVLLARSAYPDLVFYQASGYDDLASRFGTFPVAYAIEVVEHLYDPRTLVKRAHDLLEPGGHLILTTPFHGYWKNLALALTGKMDQHFTALWDHGHIKFWSERTLSTLLSECEFEPPRFYRVGRIPPFAMSMIAVARKPN